MAWYADFITGLCVGFFIGAISAHSVKAMFWVYVSMFSLILVSFAVVHSSGASIVDPKTSEIIAVILGSMFGFQGGRAMYREAFGDKREAKDD